MTQQQQNNSPTHAKMNGQQKKGKKQQQQQQQQASDPSSSSSQQHHDQSVIPPAAAQPPPPTTSNVPPVPAESNSAPSKSATKRAKRNANKQHQQQETGSEVDVRSSSSSSSPSVIPPPEPAAPTTNGQTKKKEKQTKPIAMTTTPAATVPTTTTTTPAAATSSAASSSNLAPQRVGVRLSASSLPYVLPHDPSRLLQSSSLSCAASSVDLFLSWLRDLNASERRGKAYLLELGSGMNHGKNAWMFLNALSQRTSELMAALQATHRQLKSAQASPLARLTQFTSSLTYILTDASQTVLDNLKQHPQLAPFFSVGLLDCAVLDPTALLSTLHLQHSDQVISSFDVHTPVLCMCNEQMTTAPAAASKSSQTVPARWKFDAFCYEPPTNGATKSQLKEWNVHVQETKTTPNVEWSSAVIDTHSYYEVPEFNAVLSRYLTQLESAQLPSSPSAHPLYIDSLTQNANGASPSTTSAASYHTFTLPLTAFTLVRSLRRFASGPILFLSVERGFSEFVTLPNQRPGIGLNSQYVQPNIINLHSIGQLVREMGGYSLHQQSRTISSVRMSVFGFDSIEEEEEEVLPLPNLNATPSKSALKSSTPPLPTDEPSPKSETESTRKVQFSAQKEKLSQKEKKLLRKAEKALNTNTNDGHKKRQVRVPMSLDSAFYTKFELQSPFDVSSVASLCFTPPTTQSASESTTKASTPVPTLKHALQVLSLASYDVDVWMRLRSFFCTPIPSSHKRLRAPMSVAPLHPGTPIEHDIFLACSRVWSRYFVQPSDIYGILPANGNVDLAFEFGSLFFIRRRYRASVSYYLKSLEWFGLHPITHYNIAQNYIKLRCYVQARDALQATLQLDANASEAAKWLAWVETQIGSPADASLSSALESQELQRAFEHPFEEPVGEEEEESVQQQSHSNQEQKEAASETKVQEKFEKLNLKEKKKQPSTATITATAAAITPAPTTPAASSESSAPPSNISHKGSVKEKREKRKLAKLAKAAEAGSMLPVSGALNTTPATNGVHTNQPAATKNATTTVPAASRIVSTSTPATSAKASVPAAVSTSASVSTPSSTPSTPSLQSLMKQNKGQSWAMMDDDEPLGPVTLHTPPNGSTAAPAPAPSTVPSRVVPKQSKSQHQQQQHQQQQHHHHSKQPNQQQPPQPHNAKAPLPPRTHAPLAPSVSSSSLTTEGRFARPADSSPNIAPSHPTRPPQSARKSAMSHNKQQLQQQQQ